MITNLSEPLRTTPGVGKKYVPLECWEDFGQLMRSFAWTLPTVDLTTPSRTNIDECAKALQDLFRQVIEAAGKTRYQNGHSAPWWSEKCKAAHKAYKEAAEGSPTQEEARKTLRNTIRRSKRAHWDEIIAEASATRNIWSVAKWRKATDRFQPPPLIDGDKSISDPKERATFLRDKLLKRKASQTRGKRTSPSTGTFPGTRQCRNPRPRKQRLAQATPRLAQTAYRSPSYSSPGRPSAST